MSTTIPDKHIRKAFLTLLAGIGTPVYDTRVPKSIIPVPATRVILSTQTTAAHNQNKIGHNWQHTLLIDIISEQQQGFSNRTTVDDIFQAINNVIDIPGDIQCDNFTIYSTKIEQVHDVDLETATTTINRKLVRYQFLLG